MAKFGGRYHVRRENIRAVGSWKPERVIVLEFPSEACVERWFSSPEYGAIARLREEGAETRAILVEGRAAL